MVRVLWYEIFWRLILLEFLVKDAELITCVLLSRRAKVSVAMVRLCCLLLLIMSFSSVCGAQQNNSSDESKKNMKELKFPLTSRSFSKYTVDGYFCSLRCDYIYDGKENRYLDRPKFEVFVKKDQTSWSWLCKVQNPEQPEAYICEGKRLDRTQSGALPPLTYQWDKDVYNLAVCKEFISHAGP